jgi:SAM-dependent methyltransferase
VNEASKTRRLWAPAEVGLLQGEGIDIGCGSDPISPLVKRFDLEDGDANEIGKFISCQFDFVFSAHCLEHMKDPSQALLGWWELVRPGGHLIVLVPDEDLYEQGYWPSLFNSDHRSTFTIGKQQSWSPRSFNVTDLMKQLPESDVVSIKLCDVGYDRRFLQSGVYPRWLAEWLARHFGFAIKIGTRFKVARLGKFLAWVLRVPIDQTQQDALAQIQAIVRKRRPEQSNQKIAAIDR